MALLGELAVNLIARTTKFEGGIRKAKAELTGFKRVTSDTSKAMSVLKGAFIGGGIVLGARSIARSFSEVALQMDDITKQAGRLGITTQALSGLRHGADLSGVAFEKLTTGMQRMQQTINDARQGTKEAEDAFKALGVSADTLAGQLPEEQLKTIAEALKNTADQSEKMDVVKSIFGRGGADLITLLDQGAKGIANFQAEAEKLGLTFDEEQGRRMEKFNDEMSRLKKVTQGWKQSLVIDVAPAVVDTVEGLRLVMQATGALKGSGGKKAKTSRGFLAGYSRGITTAAGFVSGATPLYRGVYQGVEGALRRTGVAFNAPAIQPHERMGLPASMRDSRLPSIPSSLPGGGVLGMTMQTAGRTALPQAIPQLVNVNQEQLKEQKEQKKRDEMQTELFRQAADSLKRMEDELKNRGVTPIP